jgi:hypothetical protein
MHVPVEFKDATHDTIVALDNTFSGQAFNIDLGFTPDQVILDPDQWMLHANDQITQSINPLSLTTQVSGSPFCPGASVNVSYNSTGSFAPGNIFTAQLSNASGSFSNPTTIGSITANSNSGNIACAVPENISGTSGYRMRVVSSSPGFTGSDNGADLSVNSCGTPSGVAASGITKNSATVSWNTVICAANYPYQYRVSGGTWIKKKATTNSKKLKSLTAGTLYEFKVKTKCTVDGSSKSSFSPTLTFSTLSAKEDAAETKMSMTEVMVFPNPAVDHFTIEITTVESDAAQIRLCNMVGQQLLFSDLKLEAGRNDFQINNASLVPGNYFISVKTSSGDIVKKITIE